VSVPAPEYLRTRRLFTGISLHTCVPGLRAENIHLYRNRSQSAPGESLEMHCLRCNRELETGQKSVALYMFAQTVGIKPRQKSTAHRISFCPQCSVSLAMGPPPEGALNLAAWDMIRDLVSSDPALNQAAWESLNGISGLLQATGTDGASSPQSGASFEF
jgi:hypothetical protein